MLTLRAHSNALVTCTTSQASLMVFPKERSKGSGKEGEVVLLSTPEDVFVPLRISWPGEYEYAGMAIRGLQQMANGEQVSYLVTTEGLRCGFLSSPLKNWSEQDIEQLGDLDVLVIPADDAALVQNIVEEVDPPVVIPLPSADAKVYQEVLKVCGAKEVVPVSEVKLKKGTLPAESREVYVLKT